MAKLVSILIPAFDAERTITGTLNSALKQTWSKKEIIVVDDGSSDNTLQIAKRFESNNVKIISQSNRGASAARNAALQSAQGDYIQWLDADDLLAADKIERQLRQATPDDSSLLLMSSAFGTFITKTSRAKFRSNTLWHSMNPVDFLLAIFTENLFMNPAVWLVSRALTERAGPWDERLSLDDDGEYFSRVVCASDYIRFSSNALSYYRLHSTSSLSRGLSSGSCESQFLSLCLRIEQLRAIEESGRVREAGIQLLNTHFTYFYPEQGDLFRRAQKLAEELGGTLTAPPMSWKYAPLQLVFGWKTAKQAQQIVAGIRLRARVIYERLL